MDRQDRYKWQIDKTDEETRKVRIISKTDRNDQ